MKMKFLLALTLFALCLAPAAFAQVNGGNGPNQNDADL
jgi:opacity protein-like surface antigen